MRTCVVLVYVCLCINSCSHSLQASLLFACLFYSTHSIGRGDTSQKPSDEEQGSSQKFMLQPLSLQLELEELWSMLSDCLDALGRTKDSHAVLVLQPLVEAFFLVHADSNDELKQSTKRRGALLTRAGRLASYQSVGDTDMPPDSPAPAPMDSISPAPGTPRGDSDVDVYAHLPLDIARFLRFAGDFSAQIILLMVTDYILIIYLLQ